MISEAHIEFKLKHSLENLTFEIEKQLFNCQMK